MLLSKLNELLILDSVAFKLHDLRVLNSVAFFVQQQRERGLPVFDADAQMNQLAQKFWGDSWENEVCCETFLVYLNMDFIFSRIFQ